MPGTINGYIAREIVLKDTEGNAVAGLNATNITVNREEIDVTTNDEDGFRTLLGEAGQLGWEISAEGIVRPGNLDLLREAFNPNTSLTKYTLEFPWGDEATADWFIGNFELGAETQEAVTFSGTFMSSGIVEYTEGAS